MSKMNNKKTTDLLIDNDKLLAAANAIELRTLEECLKELIKLANNIYNKVFHNSRQEHPKKFPYCMRNSQQIMDIITTQHQKGMMSPLTKAYYLEAWLALLQADMNALNLNPANEYQLRENDEKLHLIETDSKNLDRECNELKTNNADYKHIDYKITLDGLLHCITNFLQTWSINKNRLKAAYYYNFAETLVEESNLENAIVYFTKSDNFYINAAKSYKSPDKTKLLTFSGQTKTRLEEIKALLNKNNSNTDSLNKLTIRLQRIPHTINPQWTIVDTLSQAIKDSPSNNRKRERPLLNEAPTSPKTKKLKEDRLSTQSHHEINLLSWTTECIQLLNEFTQMGINDNLEGLVTPFHIKSFDERRAIVYNNYAISIIQDLTTRNNASDSEKLNLLKKAKNLFLKSSTFYNQANLLEEKVKAEQCINIIELSIKKLASIGGKKSNCDVSNPPRLPARYTRTFFRNLSCSENHVQKIDIQSSLSKKLV